MKILLPSLSVFIYFLLLLWGDFFAPGVLYLLDYGFVPHPIIDWTSSLAILLTQFSSLLLGPALASKIIFLGILLGASILGGLFALILAEIFHLKDKGGKQILVFLGIVFLTINPFAYERMMVQPLIYAGIIALGYMYYFLFFRKKYFFAAISSGVALALFPHAILMIALLVLLYIVFFIRNRESFRGIFLIGVITLCININWILPPLLGYASSIRSIETFSLANLEAFKTQSLAPLDVISTNLLLYGFWGERYSNHFFRVDILSSLWFIAGFFILAITFYGGYTLYKKGYRKLLVASGIIIVVSLFLGIGIASPLSAPITEFLFHYFSFFRGYREPQKWIGLIVIIYTIGFLAGSAFLLEKWKNDFFLRGSYMISILILLLVWSPGPLPGYHGQLRNTHFPPEYEILRKELLQKNPAPKVLALPWHLYIGCNWIGRPTVGNPIAGLLAPLDVTVSDTIEVADILYSNSIRPLSKDIDIFLEIGDGDILSKYGYTHILLMKQCARSDALEEFLDVGVDSGMLFREKSNEQYTLYIFKRNSY